MNPLYWLAGRFSHRAKALAFYRRGMSRANSHDHLGAVDDYTAAIGMIAVPADVKAMALYNRALAHLASGDNPKGVGDLDAVLAMREGLVNIKTQARQKLVRMKQRADASRR